MAEEMFAIDPANRPPAPLRLKLAFWILLGMLSTAFAEVVSGSMRFPFFTPWGVIVTNPLYSLHILVLTTVIVRHRWLTWPGLLFAGALFGLYEAYVTKVLWNPPFAPGLATVGEVAWLHVVLLVLWWHPIFAFILPLLVGELTLTRSRHVVRAVAPEWRARLNPRTRTWVLLFAAVCGVLISGNAPSPSQALLSPLANGALLLALIALWRRAGGAAYRLEELLPGRRALGAMAVALGLMYVVLGTFLLPERLPGLPGHVLILCLYALFVFLLAESPHADPSAEGPATVAGPQPLWRHLIAFVVVAGLAAFAAKAVLGPASGITLLANWVAACTAGLYIYGKAAFPILRRRQPPVTTPGFSR